MHFSNTINPKPVRYIVALHAESEEQFVSFAQKNFSDVAKDYLLGDHSHPHVTLVQFHGSDSEYHKILKFLSQVVERPDPKISGMQFSYDANDQEIMWAGLSVDKSTDLVALHYKLVDFLDAHNIACLTLSKALYAPHITLARIQTQQISAVKFNPVTKFNLIIGVGDEFGQLTEIKMKFAVPAVKAASWLNCCIS